MLSEEGKREATELLRHSYSTVCTLVIDSLEGTLVL